MKAIAALKLGSMVDILSGFAFKSELFNDSEGIPVIRIRDVVRGISETYYRGDYDSTYIVNNGEILIGMDGEFNIARWRGGSALLNQRVCRIKSCSSELDDNYLFHFLPSALKRIEDVTPFVTVKHLSVKTIRDIKIPLPPITEQKRIAAILNKAEEVRGLRRKALSQLDAIAQSIFLEMFGESVENPKNSQITSLGSHLSFLTSGGRGWAKFYSSTGRRFIRSLDVQMNYISDDEAVYVTPPDNAEARRTMVAQGDVLLTITGSRIGRVAPVPENFAGAFVSQHVAILRPNPTIIDPVFLSFFLNMQSGGQRQIAKFQYGQTKPGLNFEQINSFKIPVPAISLQKEFVRRVEVIEQLKTNHRASLAQLDALFASLQHRAFRGEL